MTGDIQLDNMPRIKQPVSKLADQWRNQPVEERKIAILLLGAFPPETREALNGCLAWPIASAVSVCVFDEALPPLSETRHWWHNPEQARLETLLGESFAVFILASDPESLPVTTLITIARKVSDNAALSMLCLAGNGWLEETAELLQDSIDTLVTFPDGMPLAEQTQHFIASIEALSHTITRPDLGYICMDFVDLCEVTKPHRRGQVMSARAGAETTAAELTQQLFAALVHATNQTVADKPVANGYYLMIMHGEGRGSLDEFMAISKVVETYSIEEAIVLVGMRFNTRLPAGELQLVVLSTTEFVAA